MKTLFKKYFPNFIESKEIIGSIFLANQNKNISISGF